MEVNLIQPGESIWGSVLKTTCHDIYHTQGYVAVEAKRVQGRPLAVLARQSGKQLFVPLILMPLRSNHRKGPEEWDALSPYGYPAPLLTGEDDGDFLDAALTAIKLALAEEKVAGMFVRLHPLLPSWPATLARHGVYVEHGETVWVDLMLSEDEIWRQTRPQTRNAIHRLTAQGVQVEQDVHYVHYRRFMELYYRTMDHNLASDWYYFNEEYFSNLRVTLGEQLSLWVAKDVTGTVIAAALITEEDGMVQYHLACTDREQPYREAMKLLLHCVRMWAKSRGNRALHLGGGVGAGQDPLFLFKSGFSKLRGRFASWRAVCDEQRYARLVAEWEQQTGCIAGGKEGYFPPYRQEVQRNRG